MANAPKSVIGQEALAQELEHAQDNLLIRYHPTEEYAKNETAPAIFVWLNIENETIQYLNSAYRPVPDSLEKKMPRRFQLIDVGRIELHEKNKRFLSGEESQPQILMNLREADAISLVTKMATAQPTPVTKAKASLFGLFSHAQRTSPTTPEPDAPQHGQKRRL